MIDSSARTKVWREKECRAETSNSCDWFVAKHVRKIARDLSPGTDDEATKHATHMLEFLMRPTAEHTLSAFRALVPLDDGKRNGRTRKNHATSFPAKRPPFASRQRRCNDPDEKCNPLASAIENSETLKTSLTRTDSCAGELSALLSLSLFPRRMQFE